MAELSGKWVGTIQGTNNGAVFAEFVSMKDGVSGVVHINDSVHGVGIYTVAGGPVDPDKIRLVLTPDKQTRIARHGIVTVIGHMGSETQFAGDWRSSVGNCGHSLRHKGGGSHRAAARRERAKRLHNDDS